MAAGNFAAEAWARTLINEAEQIAPETLEFVIQDDERQSLTSMLESCYSQFQTSLEVLEQFKKDLPTMDHSLPAYTDALVEANQAHDDITTTFQSKLDEWESTQHDLIPDAFNLEQTSAKIQYLEKCVIWLQKALEKTINPINTDGGAEAVAGPAAVVPAEAEEEAVDKHMPYSAPTNRLKGHPSRS